jgi:2-oxo-3-hexenedioate decarboxylase/2-keto-4-pentenoate hydratase
MMTEPEIQQAAQTLADARLARGRFGSLPASLCPPDEATAYRIQAALHLILDTRGEGGFAGHKIGCTTPVMQAYLNIHNPSAGGVLEREIQQSPATVTTRGVGAAVARDASPGSPPISATSSAMPIMARKRAPTVSRPSRSDAGQQSG